MANTTHPTGKPGQGGAQGAQGAHGVQDAAKGMMDKARDAASDVADRARSAAAAVGDRAEHATARAGSGLESLGHAVRDHMPHEGTMGAVADRAAGGLESAGKYLKDEGLGGMADDLTDMIRRNPFPALLMGIGIGYLIARATRS